MTSITIKMLFTNETAANGIVPAKCPTITLSAVCTRVWPSCEITTGIAKVRLVW
jgi:hypothetical protein